MSGRERGTRAGASASRAEIEALDALLGLVSAVHAIAAGDVGPPARRPAPPLPPPSGRGKRRIGGDRIANPPPSLEGFVDKTAAHLRLLGTGGAAQRGSVSRRDESPSPDERKD